MGRYVALLLTNKNKHSMEKEVNKILERLSMQVISLDEARAEMRILGLFNVVGQSEQLVCKCNTEHTKEEVADNECVLCWQPIKAN
jgi:hypothetical protein